MEGWLWFVIFYVVVALVWTFRRYLRAANKDTWKKNLSLHVVESFSWLLVLFRTDYYNDGDTREEKKDNK